MDKLIGKEVPLEEFKNALFMAGAHWDETLTKRQIDNITCMFALSGWRVVYDR